MVIVLPVSFFLGSYSYNHSTNVEIYNEGISFTSRPIKLKRVLYTYVANNDQGGIVNCNSRNREGRTNIKAGRR